MAELAIVFGRSGGTVLWEYITETHCIVTSTVSLALPELLLRLGGVVKAGRILAEHKPASDVAARCVEEMQRNASDQSRRVGVSMYAAEEGVSMGMLHTCAKNVHNDLLEAKKRMREEGGTFRLVATRDLALPSVVVVTERLLERGGECACFVHCDKSVTIGWTEAVQAFHAYRHRDMHRPSRDAKRGMLPPKVAQMMVNLACPARGGAGAPAGGTILDPFCGSGTVLQEAALLGYRIVGSDISADAVQDTKENMEWLQKNFEFQISNQIQNSNVSNIDSKFNIQHSKFFIGDVRVLTEHIEKNSIDAIVTEPWLGPPLKGGELPAQLAEIRREALAVLTDAFQAFAQVVKKGGRVVIVLPVIGEALMPIAAIEKQGWRVVSLLPKGMPRFVDQTDRGTILYRRPEQHIGREITAWER